MITRKKELKEKNITKDILKEQKQWEEDKKRIGDWVEKSGSGMYARWFDADCYQMDKYFEEKLKKQKKQEEQTK